MAIDTTGGIAAETGTATAAPKIARASDLSQLPDDALLQELDLGGKTQEATPATATEGDHAIRGFTPEQTPGDTGAARAETAENKNEAAAKDSGEAGAGEQVDEAAAAKPLQAQFSVFEGDEELEIPELTIKFKAAGEERDLPLDRVVKLAQQGYYNEERAEEMRAFREQQPQIEQAFQNLQEQNQMLVEGWRRVLSGDEAYLAQEQEEYLRTQSPEARAQRLAEENAYLKGQTRQSQVDQQASQFVQGTLVPGLQQLETEHPEVSFEEIVGRFNLLTAPLMVRGQIPPQKFNEVSRLLQTELRPWVDAQNEKRAEQKKVATQTTQRATAEVAAAKRQVSRAVMPQGTQATGAQKAPQKKYVSATDIFDDLANIAKPDPV